jgi:acetyl-CoA carboxylase biotin carboxyl carrier protein
MTEKNHDSDVAFIQALAELLNKNDLAELSVKREYGDNDSLNVRVSKYAAPAQVSYAAPAAAAPAAPAASTPAAATAAQAAASGDPANHPGAVSSPMVGTVYLSPEPGADPFIAIGTPDRPDHRGHEDDEPHTRAPRRDSQAYPRRRRVARRIWRTAPHH